MLADGHMTAWRDIIPEMEVDYENIDLDRAKRDFNISDEEMFEQNRDHYDSDEEMNKPGIPGLGGKKATFPGMDNDPNRFKFFEVDKA